MDEKSSTETKPVSKNVVEIPVGKSLAKARSNPWIVSTFILGIVLIIVIVMNRGGTTTPSPEVGTIVTADEAGAKVLDFIKSNPALQGEVSLVSSAREGSLYQVTLSYQGQNVQVFATLDGLYLIGDVVPLSGTIPPQQEPTEPVVIDVSIDDDAVLGSADAPITIVEFSDFQCPFCERFYTETLPSIKKDYIDTGKVKIVFRDFPLTSIHPEAQKAAEAAECVREKGGDEAYYKFHDELFENQNSLSVENYKKWAKEMKYDITVCLDTGKMADEVAGDQADGMAVGVQGTPAFFINGLKVEGALPFAQFKQIIDAELAKTGDSQVEPAPTNSPPTNNIQPLAGL